jgi:hypothetical protein
MMSFGTWDLRSLRTYGRNGGVQRHRGAVALKIPTNGIVFDPLRQFLVTGSDSAHPLFSVHIIDGFGSSQDVLSACSQVHRER